MLDDSPVPVRVAQDDALRSLYADVRSRIARGQLVAPVALPYAFSNPRPLVEVGAVPAAAEPLQVSVICTPEADLPKHHVYKVAICLVLQGSKRLSVGRQVMNFGAGDGIIVGVDVPLVSRITDASVERPYVAVVLPLHLDLLREVADALSLQARAQNSGGGRDHCGVFACQFTERAVAQFAEVVKLLDLPAAWPAFLPGRLRELYYTLLTTPGNEALLDTTALDGRMVRVARVIEHMRRNFPAAIPASAFASIAQASESSVRAHFVALTGLSPMQYYKRLKLLEAKKQLDRGSERSVAEVAYAVGYESASQFSREYRRMFGETPSKRVLSV